MTIFSALMNLFLGGFYDRWRTLQSILIFRAWKSRIRFMRGSSAIQCGEIGPGVVIGHNSQLKKCSIGRFTYISNNCRVMRCDIGSFCQIGPELLAGLGRHPTYKVITTYPSFYSTQHANLPQIGEEMGYIENLPIIIGNDVLIGSRVIISDGVMVGDGAIIGDGSVVNRDVPSYSVVSGVPAKVVSQRFNEDEIKKLKELKWWNKDIDWLRENAKNFWHSKNLDELYNDATRHSDF